MPQYRKKPVVVEAVQWTMEDVPLGTLVVLRATVDGERRETYYKRLAETDATWWPQDRALWVPTQLIGLIQYRTNGSLRALQRGSSGTSWTNRKIRVEEVTSLPDIFTATYEPVDPAPADKVSEMPEPDALFPTAEGGVMAAMFWYASESCNPKHIAQDNGFKLQVLTMANDHAVSETSPAYIAWEAGENPYIHLWNPRIPEGWKLASKHDTEDGPVAFIIQPVLEADAKGGG